MIKQNNALSPLIFVVYDGINNSIFDGQVLQPLIKHKKNNPEQEIIIISFEKKIPSQEHLRQRIPKSIATIICFKKLPFLGLLSLLPAIFTFKNYLKTLKSYSIMARGPLAGYVSLKALNAHQCLNFIIQIRGLLTAEYSYEHANEQNIFKKKWHQWRMSIFGDLEKKLYITTHKKSLPIHFQAVSDALKEHVITYYQTSPALISLAQHDIPHHIPKEKVLEWRGATRTELEIPQQAHVYCYNGSLKPWQCPEKTIEFFKNELEKNAQSYLLILTHDVVGFQHLLQRACVPEESYTIMTVEHVDMYHYLAACDAGIIFREEHVINWTSRPTKILEYQAVGLPIIHNNTIAMLMEKQN